MWGQYILLVFLIIMAGLMVRLMVRLLFRLYISLQGAFFAETSDTRIKQFMSLVPLKKGMIAADLGSGDGRILIKLAQKANLTAVGYEIDPKLVKLSRAKIAEAGLSSRITIKQQSFWRAELGNFDLVTVYGVQEMMPRLEKKLLKELKKGASIVSVYFKFPSWMEKKRLGDIRLYQK